MSKPLLYVRNGIFYSFYIVSFIVLGRDNSIHQIEYSLYILKFLEREVTNLKEVSERRGRKVVVGLLREKVDQEVKVVLDVVGEEGEVDVVEEVVEALVVENGNLNDTVEVTGRE